MPIRVGFGQGVRLTVGTACCPMSPQGAVTEGAIAAAAVVQTEFMICCVGTAVLFMTTVLRP